MMPRLSRFIFVSIGAFAVLVAAIVFVTRLTRTDYACLALFSNSVDILELSSGKMFAYSTLVPRLDPQQVPNYAFNSDHTRLATWENGLIVQIFNKRVTLSRGAAYSQNGQGDVLWSPDSRFIAYLWTERNGASIQRFFALADANGQLIHKTKFDIPTNQKIRLAGWSPDGKYIAAVNFNDAEKWTAKITFWSVSDLNSTDAGANAFDVDSGCLTRNGPDRYWNCDLWNNQGHTAAYTITKNDDSDQANRKTKLVIMVPGDKGQRLFDLPDSNLRAINWSPDGLNVLVSSYAVETSPPVPLARLDIIGIDGTRHDNIGSAAVADLVNPARTPYVEAQWSPDSKLLYYAYLSPTDWRQYQIMRYDPATNQSHTLYNLTRKTLPFGKEDIAELTFNVSPDSQFIAVNFDANELYLLSTNGDFATGLQSAGDLFWSPDSSKLAAYSYNPQSQQESIRLFSSKGIKVDQIKPASFINNLTWTQCGIPQ